MGAINAAARAIPLTTYDPTLPKGIPMPILSLRSRTWCRHAIGAIGCGSLLLTSGCGAIRQDLYHPGGYPGFLLDRHSFNASQSKQLLLLRSAIILAMAARMGQGTVGTDEADAFVSRLANASREVNYAAGDLYPNAATVADSTTGCKIGDSTANPKCAGFAVNFESEVPLLETSLVRAVIAALPIDKAKNFIGAVQKGDIFSAAFKLLGTFATTAMGLHYAAGSFRSGLEIVGYSTNECSASVIEKDKETGAMSDGGQQNRTLKFATDCLKSPVDDLFKRTDGNELTALNGKVDPSAFKALFVIANSACTALPLSAGSPDINKAKADRIATCGTIVFNPIPRPTSP